MILWPEPRVHQLYQTVTHRAQTAFMKKPQETCCVIGPINYSQQPAGAVKPSHAGPTCQARSGHSPLLALAGASNASWSFLAFTVEHWALQIGPTNIFLWHHLTTVQLRHYGILFVEEGGNCIDSLRILYNRGACMTPPWSMRKGRQVVVRVRGGGSVEGTYNTDHSGTNFGWIASKVAIAFSFKASITVTVP